MEKPVTTKQNIKTITRWLALHYDESAEQAMFCLEREIDDLAAWKSSAMQVMNDIDLQAIGKEMDLKLGSNIGVEILPYIRKLKGMKS